MKYFILQSLFAVLCAVLSPGLVLSQETEPRYEELPNFHKISDQLYRGAQPKKGGLKKLHDLGVRTILNLRGESEETNQQQAEAESLGMQYIVVSMSNAGRPTEEQVSRALSVIEGADKAPVFVHCKRGADRTGAIIAAYRIKHDGWTDEQALEEAKRCGMGLIQFRKRGFISDYYRQQQKDETAKSEEKLRNTRK
jgi:tyrosine-protein phosphatase SIW14